MKTRTLDVMAATLLAFASLTISLGCQSEENSVMTNQSELEKYVADNPDIIPSEANDEFEE